ncbi:hypothetical protein [Paenibacillus sp. R14(2021)]|uniref:hypothetical protein n=1 Tax=Paenibacillus sp. R14(2021) TaxID=2859228 RepID=UPI001C614BB2|nr:hypothetical protein [Paenibacillus sp. R14(2021)]
MNYLEWNDKIAQYFFNESMAGREVLLYIDRQLIEELGQESNENLDDFLKCIFTGPWWTEYKRSTICQKALLTMHNWRKRGYMYPPYMGYLALFVLAASMDNEMFSEIAYYPKLRSLLGEAPTSGQVRHFDQMFELWADLEIWSRDDKLEELGRFNLTIRGNNRHVGIPFSQTILSDKERKKLPLLFNKAHMVAPATQNDNILRSILTTNGEDVFSQKTLRLLRGQESNSSLLLALLNLIREELDAWDGTLPDGIAPLNGERYLNSSIKLCIDLDKVNKRAKFTFRIQSNNEFPEEGLTLKRKGFNQIVFCKGSIINWSTELRNQQGLYFDPSSDLLHDLHFEDDSANWRARFKGNSLRIFVRGGKLGLQNHYVEVEGLDKSGQFVILAHSELTGIIHTWGQNECERFEKVNYEGIPSDWVLYAGMNARNSCPQIEALAIRSEGRVRLVGGMRIGKGNVFYHSSPPKVILENIRGSVRWNDQQLTYNSETEQWEFPNLLPVEELITVKVYNEEEQNIAKATFQLIPSKILLRDINLYLHRTRSFERDSSNFIGVYPIPEKDFMIKSYDPSFPRFLSFEMILIGKRPGQIIHWTKHSVFNWNWHPVWALIKHGRNHWGLIFCSLGTGVDECFVEEPTEEELGVVQWKEAVIYMNNFATSDTFSFPLLKDLWQSYLGAATNEY